MSIRAFLSALLHVEGDRAAVRYVGQFGTTQPCIRAIEMVLQTEGIPEEAVLISCSKYHGADHAILLVGDRISGPIVVEEGFASGYGGEAPKGLSWTVALFEAIEIKLYEVKVNRSFMDRIRRHDLTEADLDVLLDRHRRLNGAHRYIFDMHWQSPLNFSGKWPIPLGILDLRLLPVAISVLKDHARWGVELNGAYSMLEDAVRTKAETVNPLLVDRGAVDLFTQAFGGLKPLLIWNVSAGETKGRLSLFTGAFQAFRNQRAHGRSRSDARQDMAELMLLNQLFELERQALPVAPSQLLPSP
jgi:hypothetical protein